MDRDGDIDDSSGMDSPFDLDQDEPSPSHEEDHPQIRVMLEDLARMESTILQIRDYSFGHEKMQWTEDEFDTFLNPSQEPWNLDDPQLRLSFQIYLSLSAHSSEATYKVIRSSIKECYPVSFRYILICVSIAVLRILVPLPSSWNVHSVENVNTNNTMTLIPKFLVANSLLFQ
ncbi:hypothetical protein L208DRAFT_328280 [Tricholoma matsutake]|nr:hypothetical protein L208DRAFT_328280 [Tricholoma matsutake 945]